MKKIYQVSLSNGVMFVTENHADRARASAKKCVSISVNTDLPALDIGITETVTMTVPIEKIDVYYSEEVD